MPLQDKNVVVVGASAGIGRAFSLRAAEAGASLVLGARHADALDRVLADTGTGRAVPVDVCDAASRGRFLDQARAHLTTVDLLLCTVGYAELRTLAETDEAGWDRTLSTNLVGVGGLMVDVLPLLAPGGVICVLSSEAASVPRRGLVPYAASKAALEAMVQGFRIEHPGTRVSCVVIGATFPTGFGDEFESAELRSSMASWRTHGLLQEEFMDPDEVAGHLVGMLGATLEHAGVCIEHVVLRSPSPVIGASKG